MKFMLIMHENGEGVSQRNDPERAPAYWAAWRAYAAAVAEAGIIVSGEGLEPPETAAILRVRDDARAVQDGPFSDSKEQLGGFFVIDVADRDAALAWAARARGGAGRARCARRGATGRSPALLGGARRFAPRRGMRGGGRGRL